ncbi:hypothetical protein Lser_V15G36532 [Lactuca serriola]
MASSQQPTTIDNLQGDVLSEIFIRLLAKQLAQMRCASNNDDILLFFKSKFSFCGGRPFTACPSRSPHHELTDFIKLPPSLSVVLTLPPSLFPSHDTDYLRIPPRFGFDPKSDDYKVTKFTRDPQLPLSACLTLDIDDCIETVDYKVEVYSMRKGIWQLVPHRFPSHLKILRAMHYKEFCVDGHDGHVHWFDYADSFWKVQNIVAFDLGEETFREMPIPDLQMVATQFSLGVLGGKLCVMFGIRYHGCEVWVMDEYGVAESWVKRYVFSEFDDVIIPYGFTLHNEFLYEVANYFDNEDDHCLGLYNPIAAKTKSFEVGYGLSKVVEYVDSLVWVAPVEHELSCCNISRLKI